MKRCIRLALVLLWVASLAAQTISFSPQTVAGKNSSLVLWAVDVSAPGKTSIPASTVYAIAASHGVGHVDATLAAAILNTRAARSIVAIGVQILGAGSAATAVATIVKNGGIVSTGTASQIQNAAIVAAGVSAILLPYLQKASPPAPAAVIANLVLAGELKLGSNGSGSALFYSLPSSVGAFVDKLP